MSTHMPNKKKLKKNDGLSTNLRDEEKLTPKILNTEEDIEEIVTMRASQFQYQSVRVNFLGHIINILSSEADQKYPPHYKNIFCCLELVMDQHLKSLKSEDLGEKKHEKKFLNKCLLAFLQKTLNFGLYKRVLASITNIISCLHKPIQISDFLFNSFKMGGSISLLSLSGLYILMDKHNLNYPDFYKKLYSLLDPAVFHFKYRARFFRDLDMFLSSKHLPAYMLAAFIKKLAQISLYGPTYALVSTIPTIYNLVNRQNVCKRLIDKTDGQKEYSSDPYIYGEADLIKCCALESSLWELQTLQSHYCPQISVVSRKVNQLRKSPKDLTSILETTTDCVFSNEIERGEKLKETPVNFSCPSGILTKTDITQAYWCVE